MNLKSRMRSRTYRVAAFFAVVIAPIEMNMHLLQNVLGEYYGASFIGVAIIMGILREITTTPVTEK